MQPAEASAGTWSRVVRLIEAHPDVKQVRLNINDHSVTVGFYETPSEETLNRIKADVCAELSGQWNVSTKPSRRARSIIRQNVVISLGVILFLIVSALAEKINLTAGVIGHEGSTVVVILNGLRLLRPHRN
jgi:hypothetical protein